MKNLNSFKAISRAIAYEARRQQERIEMDHKRVIQETRRWDDNKDATYSMRSKENAQDYRYFPEPDLPPLELSESYLEQLRAAIPEMAEARRKRYVAEYGLTAYEAELLTGSKAMVDFFEETVSLGAAPKEVSNWMLDDLLRVLKEKGVELKSMGFTPDNLAKLLCLLRGNKINRNTAGKVFQAVFEDNADVEGYVRDHGLEQVTDTGALEAVVDQVLKDNPKSIEDYKAGKKKAQGFLMGQCMKALKGKGDPKAVTQLLNSKLQSL